MIDFVATLITVAIFISPVIVIAGVTVLIVKKLNNRKIGCVTGFPCASDLCLYPVCKHPFKGLCARRTPL